MLEYKAAMHAVDELNAEREALEHENIFLEEKTKTIQTSIEKKEAVLAKYELRADTMKIVEQAVSTDVKKA